jgi:alkanesulfonate monooxygenase SsuD/methylene tetrahydromethanopterin reductase-like flavin-dependent oxidoreductase (luciferase family)
VILDFLHETTLSASIDTVRKGAAISGNSVDLSYSTSIVMTDGDLEAVRPHMTYRLCDSPTDIREQIGMTDEDVERIRNAMADGLHVAAQYVSDDWVLPFVIHGTEDECRAQLTELVETHMLSEFMIPVFEMQDQRDYVERVGRLFDHH